MGASRGGESAQRKAASEKPKAGWEPLRRSLEGFPELPLPADSFSVECPP